MKKFKRLSVRLAAVLIAVAVVFAGSALFTSAANYYYSGSTSVGFISEIAISNTSTDENVSKAHLSSSGYTVIDQNCNKDAASTWTTAAAVYLGYKTTGNASEAITGLRLLAMTNSQYTSSGITSDLNTPPDTLTERRGGVDYTFYLIKNAPASVVTENRFDFNRGCGMNDTDWIFMYYTKDPAFGPPITSLRIRNSTTNSIIPGELSAASGYYDVVGFELCVKPNGAGFSYNNVGSPVSLNNNNERPNAQEMYLQYKSDFVPLNISGLQTAYNGSASYTTNTSYTQASRAVLVAARAAAHALLNSFTSSTSGSDTVYCTTKTQAEFDNATAAINNALANLKTTVIFNENGGESFSPDSIEVTIGTASTKSISVAGYTPTKSGFTFNGWSKNKDATSGSKTNVTVGFNTKLYAIFKRTLTGTFNYLTATGAAASQTESITIYNRTNSGDITAPAVSNSITKGGYTYGFLGWRENTAAAVATIDKGADINLSANKAFYAVYSRDITVSYNANDGSGAPEAQTVTKYLNASGNETAPAVTLSATEPTRTNYSFTGWNYTATGTDNLSAGAEITPAASTILYAGWEGNPYKIVFNANGGSGTMADLDMVYGTAKNLPENTVTESALTKPGYEFIRWDSQTDGNGTPYSGGQSVKDIGAVTLYAVWSNATYDITYAGDGIDLSSCTPLYATGDRELEAIIYALDGYHLNAGITVEIGGATLVKGDDYTYVLAADRLTGTLTVKPEAIINNVNIIATASAHLYDYSYSGNDGDSTHTAYCECGATETQNCSGGEATCTEPATCEKCNTTYGDSLGGHTYGAWESDNNGKHVRTCGRDSSHTETVDCNSDIVIAAKAETCTETGLTAGNKCSVCDYITVPQTVTNKLGHDWGAWTTNNDGSHTKICDNDPTHTETEACNSDIVLEAVPATCEGTGLTAGSKCSVCNYITLEQQVTPPTDHEWRPWVSDNNGSHTRICDKDPTHTETEACNSDIVLEAVSETCTKVGLTEGNVCSECHYITKRQQAINSLGHDWGDFTANNNGTHTRVCKRDATHTETEACNYNSVTTPDTCETDGFTTHTCKVCAYSYKDSTVVALGHNWDDWTTNNDGTHSRVCKRDTSHVETEACTGSVNRVILAATCKDKGTMGTYCGVCDALLSTAEIAIDPANHGTHGTYEAVIEAATCTAKGEMGTYCYGCDALLSTAEIAINPANHGAHGTYEAVITAATCTAKGTMGTYCDGCDVLLRTEEIAIDPAYHGAHETYDKIITAATCTAKGLKDVYCAGCNELVAPSQVIDELGHDFRIIRGTTADGNCSYVTYICRRCGYMYSDVVLTLKDEDGNILDGEDFTVTDPNSLSTTYVSDSDGKIRLTIVPTGEYTIVGKKVGEAYSLRLGEDGIPVFVRTTSHDDCPCQCHDEGFCGDLFRFIYCILNRIFGNRFKCCDGLGAYKRFC